MEKFSLGSQVQPATSNQIFVHATYLKRTGSTTYPLGISFVVNENKNEKVFVAYRCIVMGLFVLEAFLIKISAIQIECVRILFCFGDGLSRLTV